MLIELFCVVDDFCKIFLPQWKAKLIENGQRKRIKDGNMSVSEIITIIIYFHQSNYRNNSLRVMGLNNNEDVSLLFRMLISYIVLKVKNKVIQIYFTVNKQIHKTLIRYKKCGIDDAMIRANHYIEKQQEIYQNQFTDDIIYK